MIENNNNLKPCL